MSLNENISAISVFADFSYPLNFTNYKRRKYRLYRMEITNIVSIHITGERGKWFTLNLIVSAFINHIKTLLINEFRHHSHTHKIFYWLMHALYFKIYCEGIKNG